MGIYLRKKVKNVVADLGLQSVVAQFIGLKSLINQTTTVLCSKLRRLKSACPSHIACYGRRAATVLCSKANFATTILPFTRYTLHITRYTVLLLLATGLVMAQEFDVRARIRELKNKNVSVRVQACEVLGKSRDKRAITALIERFKREENIAVKEAILEALGAIGTEDVLPGIMLGLKDKEPGVRMSAVASLAYIQGEQAKILLKRVLQDKTEKNSVKKFALRASGMRKEKDLVNDIRVILKDRDKGVRAEAALILGEIGGGGAEDALQEALNDDDPVVRQAAVEGLSKIDTKKARKKIEKALTDKDEKVRKAARRYLKGEKNDRKRIFK